MSDPTPPEADPIELTPDEWREIRDLLRDKQDDSSLGPILGPIANGFKTIAVWIMENIPAPLVKVAAVFLFAGLAITMPPFKSGYDSWKGALDASAAEKNAERIRDETETRKLLLEIEALGG